MPNTKNDVQDMSINDPQQNISMKITFSFKYFKTVNFGLFFENYPHVPTYVPTNAEQELQRHIPTH